MPNNTGIVDLSDYNRPIKVAERYNELYEQQWRRAFEVLDKGDSQDATTTLLRILTVYL